MIIKTPTTSKNDKKRILALKWTGFKKFWINKTTIFEKNVRRWVGNVGKFP